MGLLKFLKDIYVEKPDQKFRKSPNCLVGFILGDPFDVPLAKFLTRFKRIYPNHVTLASIPFAFIAAYMFFNGNLLYGAIFYYIHFIIDGVDGKLARLTNRTSSFGAKLDYYVDKVNHAMMYFGLWWSQYYLLGDWSIGICIIFFHYAIMIFGFIFIKETNYKTIFPGVGSYYSGFEEAVGTFLFAPIFGVVRIAFPILIVMQFISYIILFLKQKKRPTFKEGIKKMLRMKKNFF